MGSDVSPSSSAGALRNADRADCPIYSPPYPNLRRALSRLVPMGLGARSPVDLPRDARPIGSTQRKVWTAALRQNRPVARSNNGEACFHSEAGTPASRRDFAVKILSDQCIEVFIFPAA